MDVVLTNQFNRHVRGQVLVSALKVVVQIGEEIVGQFSRGELETWLRKPNGEIANDRTTLMAVPNGVALAVADKVPMWPLGDPILRRLKTIVAAGQ